ncbi:MAG: hypothetical protein AB7O95_21110, partial [Geminicoccaceae bacterium]
MVPLAEPGQRSGHQRRRRRGLLRAADGSAGAALTTETEGDLVLKANRAATAALAASLMITPWIVRAQDSSPPADPGALTGLQDTVRSLTEQVNAQRGELDDLRAQLAKSQAAVQEAQNATAARDASLRTAQDNRSAAEARAQDLEQQLQGLRDELAAKNDAQRTLSEQAESVAATAAAQETKLGEVEASLDKQRKELLAARNDATSAQREAAEKDKQIQALANAGRELVASAEALEADKKSLSEQLATSNASTDGLQHEVQQGRSELLAVRNDLSSAERELAERDKQIAALTSAARELVAGNEALEADEASLADQLTTSRSDLQRLQGDLQAA